MSPSTGAEKEDGDSSEVFHVDDMFVLVCRDANNVGNTKRSAPYVLMYE